MVATMSCRSGVCLCYQLLAKASAWFFLLPGWSKFSESSTVLSRETSRWFAYRVKSCTLVLHMWPESLLVSAKKHCSASHIPADLWMVGQSGQLKFWQFVDALAFGMRESWIELAQSTARSNPRICLIKPLFLKNFVWPEPSGKTTFHCGSQKAKMHKETPGTQRKRFWGPKIWNC